MLLLVIILILLFYISGSAEAIDSPFAGIKFRTVKDFPNKPFDGIYLSRKPGDIIWKYEDGGYTYAWAGKFFPFARFHVPRATIDAAFYELMNWEPVVENLPFVIPRLPHKLKIHDRYVTVGYEPKAQVCVDYFQEEVRMVCRRRNKSSHWDLYKKMYTTVSGPANFNPQYAKIQDSLWERSYSCTEIDPEVTKALIEWAATFTSISTVLDMSAGRGSRLTAAIATPRIYMYTGVDPSSLSHEWYETQAQYWCDVYNASPVYMGTKYPKNFRVIKSGFVEAELPYDNYDMMFSSPPYFDLEEYSSDASQSIKQHNNLQAWLDGFMLKSVDKIIAHLRVGGLLCINISVSRVYEDDWVTPILKHVSIEYLGCFGTYKSYKKGVQPIWIWRKTGPPISHIPLITNILDDLTVERLQASTMTDAIRQAKNCLDKSLKVALVKVPLDEDTNSNPDSDLKFGVWSLSDTHKTIIFTKRFLPLGVFHITPPPLQFTLSWEIVNQPWYSKHLAHRQFLGKDIWIRVMSADPPGLEYFTDPVTIICRQRDNESPWNMWLREPTDGYAATMDRFYFSKKLCIASSIAVHMSLLEYMRSLYPCREIFLPENSIFGKTVFSAIAAGFDKLHIQELNRTRAERTETILRWYGAKNWRIFIGEGDFETYDLILYVPTYFDIQRPSDDPNESYIQYTRLDVWTNHINESIAKYGKLLQPGGIVCLLMHVDSFHGYLQPGPVLGLEFLGAIGLCKNSIMNILVYQKQNISR